MQVIPAIDVREGACVQLVGGDYARERVRLPDLEAVARRWRQAGFSRLHVVDLDAATGRGSNAEAIAPLLDGGVEVQVGGGVRDEAAVARWLERGAARVVVGTRAIEEPAWLERVAGRFPGRVVLAADVRGEGVVTRGWAQGSGLTYPELLARVAALPLAGVLMTAVHVEGRLEGPDLELVRAARPLVAGALIASGGVGGVEDVQALAEAGADAVVVGMALYTGRLQPAALKEDFT